MENFIIHRGSGKSINEYFAGIKRLYQTGRISFDDYIGMIGAARVLLCGQDQDEVLQWMENEINKNGVCGE